MQRYFKVLITLSCAFMIIFLLSGFENRSLEKTITELMQQRVLILESGYLGGISYEATQELLSDIATDPLVSSDLKELALMEPTDLDIVQALTLKDMKILEKKENETIVSATIEWTMQGLEFAYIESNEYCFVINEENGKQMLANIIPLV